MNTTSIPMEVIDFLADEEDYDEHDNLTAQAVATLTTWAQRNLTADDMRLIHDFGNRFIAALRSLAIAEDYDQHGKLILSDGLYRAAWARARPEKYEALMRHCRAARILDEWLDPLVAESKAERYTDEATGEDRFLLFDEMDKLVAEGKAEKHIDEAGKTRYRMLNAS